MCGYEALRQSKLSPYLTVRDYMYPPDGGQNTYESEAIYNKL